MRRTILVTVSGMVGSGKSTVVEHAASVLQRAGVQPERWRFQRLPCINLGKSDCGSRGNAQEAAQESAPPKVRGAKYHREQLSAVTAAGHLARILAFYVCTTRPFGPKWAIVNRYFYDSFAHFDMGHRPTRRYAGFLARLVPRPDIAILLIASPQTIARRRRNYALDYIAPVAEAYDVLPRTFPHVLRISSERGCATQQQVESALLQLLKASCT